MKYWRRWAQHNSRFGRMRIMPSWYTVKSAAEFIWSEKSFSAARGCQAPKVHRTLIWGISLLLAARLQFNRSTQTHLVAIVMTSSIQPRRRDVLDDVEIRAGWQEHCDADEAWRRRIPWDGRLRVILQDAPQPPQRAWINQVKVGARLLLHELLVIGEELKVGLVQPLLEALVEPTRVPGCEWDVFEERRAEEVKLRLAHDLQGFLHFIRHQWAKINSLGELDELKWKFIVGEKLAAACMHNCSREIRLLGNSPENLRSLSRSCFRRRARILQWVRDWTSWRYRANLKCR